MTINISYQLVKQGDSVNTVYLVNKGQVSIWKTGIEAKEEDTDEDNDEQALGNMSTFIKSQSVNIKKKSSLGLDKEQEVEKIE